MIFLLKMIYLAIETNDDSQSAGFVTKIVHELLKKNITIKITKERLKRIDFWNMNNYQKDPFLLIKKTFFSKHSITWKGSSSTVRGGLFFDLRNRKSRKIRLAYFVQESYLYYVLRIPDTKVGAAYFGISQ